MKTPTLAPVSFQISSVSAGGGVHVRPLRKPMGMTPRQWKRVWRNSWVGSVHCPDMMNRIQRSNTALDCPGAWAVRNWQLEHRIMRRIGDKPVVMGARLTPLAEMEADARAALEERTRECLIAQEEAEIERRQVAEAEEYRLDMEWKAEQRRLDLDEDDYVFRSQENLKAIGKRPASR